MNHLLISLLLILVNLYLYNCEMMINTQSSFGGPGKVETNPKETEIVKVEAETPTTNEDSTENFTEPEGTFERGESMLHRIVIQKNVNRISSPEVPIGHFGRNPRGMFSYWSSVGHPLQILAEKYQKEVRKSSHFGGSC